MQYLVWMMTFLFRMNISYLHSSWYRGNLFNSIKNRKFRPSVWQEFPERIVGFLERGVSWDNGKWNYIRHSTTVSIVLTSNIDRVKNWSELEIICKFSGLSFFHKKYLYLYTYELPAVIRKRIDRIVNCEDIGMNFLVSHRTQKAPLKVIILLNILRGIL